ncbi:cytochrome b/b6 domain-containing protein [Deferribacter autotrophicus]|uniref:Cytochrome b/b6 domain-containing protein n=1 Tax=Deferribacter autotrophicus TaxID=500465 RepID=A0A5A8F8R5_9BACT|nr:cytochrome b/b6 domain-containing protein [Deferribacter autotrophicus]KAA0258912.1 cytochrome b/b6 domain-containing protein [Deferribacter autotrophicus]
MMKKYPLIKIVRGKKYYLKLTPAQRYQHFILMTTFIFLILTGFPLKFHYYPWAKVMINMFGGLQVTTVIHRICGVTMVGLFFFHWYYLFRNLYVYYIRPSIRSNSFSFRGLFKFIYHSPMFPRGKDLKDVVDFLKYAFFITDEKPKHERFHWREKFDYWAVFWGIPLLGLTGLILWFETEATKILPGWALNISFIAHSDEALLAASVILIWHMYNAHVNYDKFPMSPLFLTGYLPEEIMKHEYYLEWQRLNELAEKHPELVLDIDSYKIKKEREIEEQYKAYMEYLDVEIKKDTSEA